MTVTLDDVFLSNLQFATASHIIFAREAPTVQKTSSAALGGFAAAAWQSSGGWWSGEGDIESLGTVDLWQSSNSHYDKDSVVQVKDASARLSQFQRSRD